jgi:flagellar basal body-associated protein FliL
LAHVAIPRGPDKARLDTCLRGPLQRVPSRAALGPRRAYGAVAQLGERLVRNEEVSGSIPLSSTMRALLPAPSGNAAFTRAVAEWRFMRALRSLLMLLLAVCVATPTLASGGGHGAEDGEKKRLKAPKKERTYTSLESWVMVDVFTISIIQDGRVRGKFTVSFGMDVPDEKLREKAEAVMPRLRDAWLSELNLYAATSLRMRRPADVVGVADLLQRSADAVLGQAGSKVLMGQAMVAMTP